MITLIVVIMKPGYVHTYTSIWIDTYIHIRESVKLLQVIVNCGAYDQLRLKVQDTSHTNR